MKDKTAHPFRRFMSTAATFITLAAAILVLGVLLANFLVCGSMFASRTECREYNNVSAIGEIPL